MATIPNTNLNIFQLRQIVSDFVDMYCDEILQMRQGSMADIESVIQLITMLKTHRFTNYGEPEDVFDWYREVLSSGKFIHFSPFLERGSEFLMIHFYNMYGVDRFSELITTASHAFNSIFVAGDTVEFAAPVNKRMEYSAWQKTVALHPWLIFVALLRNTYIDMGEDPEPKKGEDDANGNG